MHKQTGLRVKGSDTLLCIAPVCSVLLAQVLTSCVLCASAHASSAHPAHHSPRHTVTSRWQGPGAGDASAGMHAAHAPADRPPGEIIPRTVCCAPHPLCCRVISAGLKVACRQRILLDSHPAATQLLLRRQFTVAYMPGLSACTICSDRLEHTALHFTLVMPHVAEALAHVWLCSSDLVSDLVSPLPGTWGGG